MDDDKMLNLIQYVEMKIERLKSLRDTREENRDIIV